MCFILKNGDNRQSPLSAFSYITFTGFIYSLILCSVILYFNPYDPLFTYILLILGDLGLYLKYLFLEFFCLHSNTRSFVSKLSSVMYTRNNINIPTIYTKKSYAVTSLLTIEKNNINKNNLFKVKPLDFKSVKSIDLVIKTRPIIKPITLKSIFSPSFGNNI